VLTRSGVTFPAIRKSYLCLTVKEVGSVAATRPIAGHNGLGVLMPHYLNTPEIKADLDESIRFFQNSCQALIVGQRTEAAILLQLSPEDLTWFSRLAMMSGIAAAVGMGSEHEAASGDKKLCFSPTEDNLRDLFLAHWALRRAQRRVSAARWRVQALPMLAIVKALGRTVCANGLRATYFAAARRAHRDLVAGVIALPPILDN
jgi:hypothetical protein